MISFVFRVFLEAKKLAEIYMTFTNIYDFDHSKSYIIDMVGVVETAFSCKVDPWVI